MTSGNPAEVLPLSLGLTCHWHITSSACFPLGEEEVFWITSFPHRHTHARAHTLRSVRGDLRFTDCCYMEEQSCDSPGFLLHPFSGPPPPPPHIRVNKKDVLISKSSINFTFNCSWFSDTNGAVKYFTVVVREADGK